MSETSELRKRAAEANASNEHDTTKGKYMTFKSGNEYFGLNPLNIMTEPVSLSSM